MSLITRQLSFAALFGAASISMAFTLAEPAPADEPQDQNYKATTDSLSVSCPLIVDLKNSEEAKHCVSVISGLLYDAAQTAKSYTKNPQAYSICDDYSAPGTKLPINKDRMIMLRDCAKAFARDMSDAGLKSDAARMKFIADRIDSISISFSSAPAPKR